MENYNPLQTLVDSSVIDGTQGEYYGRYKVVVDDVLDTSANMYRYHKYNLKYQPIYEWSVYSKEKEYLYSWDRFDVTKVQTIPDSTKKRYYSNLSTTTQKRYHEKYRQSAIETNSPIGGSVALSPYIDNDDLWDKINIRNASIWAIDIQKMWDKTQYDTVYQYQPMFKSYGYDRTFDSSEQTAAYRKHFVDGALYADSETDPLLDAHVLTNVDGVMYYDKDAPDFKYFYPPNSADSQGKNPMNSRNLVTHDKVTIDNINTISNLGWVERYSTTSGSAAMDKPFNYLWQEYDGILWGCPHINSIDNTTHPLAYKHFHFNALPASGYGVMLVGARNNTIPAADNFMSSIIRYFVFIVTPWTVCDGEYLYGVIPLKWKWKSSGSDYGYYYGNRFFRSYTQRGDFLDYDYYSYDVNKVEYKNKHDDTQTWYYLDKMADWYDTQQFIHLAEEYQGRSDNSYEMAKYYLDRETKLKEITRKDTVYGGYIFNSQATDASYSDEMKELLSYKLYWPQYRITYGNLKLTNLAATDTFWTTEDASSYTFPTGYVVGFHSDEYHTSYEIGTTPTVVTSSDANAYPINSYSEDMKYYYGTRTQEEIHSTEDGTYIDKVLWGNKEGVDSFSIVVNDRTYTYKNPVYKDDNFFAEDYLGEEITYGLPKVGEDGKPITQGASAGYYYLLVETKPWDGTIYPSVCSSIKLKQQMGQGKLSSFGLQIADTLELQIAPLPESIFKSLAVGNEFTFYSDYYIDQKMIITTKEKQKDGSLKLGATHALKQMKDANISSTIDRGRDVVMTKTVSTSWDIDSPMPYRIANPGAGVYYINKGVGYPTDLTEVQNRINRRVGSLIPVFIWLKDESNPSTGFYYKYYTGRYIPEEEMNKQVEWYCTQMAKGQLAFLVRSDDEVDGYSFFDFKFMEDKGEISQDILLSAEWDNRTTRFKNIYLNKMPQDMISVNDDGSLSAYVHVETQIPMWKYESDTDEYWNCSYYNDDKTFNYNEALEYGKPKIYTGDIVTNATLKVMGAPVNDYGYIQVGDIISFTSSNTLGNDFTKRNVTKSMIITSIETDLYTTTFKSEIEFEGQINEYKIDIDAEEENNQNA